MYRNNIIFIITVSSSLLAYAFNPAMPVIPTTPDINRENSLLMFPEPPMPVTVSYPHMEAEETEVMPEMPASQEMTAQDIATQNIATQDIAAQENNMMPQPEIEKTETTSSSSTETVRLLEKIDQHLISIDQQMTKLNDQMKHPIIEIVNRPETITTYGEPAAPSMNQRSAPTQQMPVEEQKNRILSPEERNAFQTKTKQLETNQQEETPIDEVAQPELIKEELIQKDVVTESKQLIPTKSISEQEISDQEPEVQEPEVQEPKIEESESHEQGVAKNEAEEQDEESNQNDFEL